MIGDNLCERVDVHFIILSRQHIALSILNNCPQTAMVAATVSNSTTQIRSKPFWTYLTQPNSRRKIYIPFYHTKSPVEEHHQAFLGQKTLWQEDIQKQITAQVYSLKSRISQLGQNDINARFPFMLYCCYCFLGVPTRLVL